MAKGQLTRFTKIRFHDGRKRVLCRTGGALPASGHDRTRPTWRWKCPVRGAITMTRTELNICQGLPLSSTAETMLLSLLFCPMPWGCTYPSCMRCTRSLAVSQNQVSHVFTEVPRPCLQLDSCETPSGDVSGDGLTSHRTSTSSLRHSRRNGPESPTMPLGGSSGA